MMLLVVAAIVGTVIVVREIAQFAMARFCKVPVARFSVGRGWARFATIAAAAVGTYLGVCIVALACFAMFGIEDGDRWYTIGRTVAGYDAATKLEVGDRIIAVDGVPLRDGRGMSLRERINARGGAPLTLTMRRAGVVRDVTVTPRRDDRGVWLLGVQLGVDVDRTRGLGAITGAAVRYPVETASNIGRNIGRLIYGDDGLFGAEQADPGGPARMVEEFRRAFMSVWENAFLFGMSLAVYQMIFVVAFDLGRLVCLALPRGRLLTRASPTARDPSRD